MNLTANEGSAAYLTTTSRSPISSAIVFTNCDFRNLTATLHGAVFVNDLNSEFRNCSFIYCQVSNVPVSDNGEGGALALFCPDASGGCNTSISFCSFTNNYARYQGGSIYWKNSQPVITNSTFMDNQAFYGPDIASFPISIHIVSIDGNATSMNTQGYEGVLSNIASGQIASSVIEASLFDHYGQVVMVDNSSSSTLLGESASTSIIGNTTTTAVNGTFTFAGFGIVAAPTNVTGITLKTAFMKTGNDSSGSVKVQVNMRDCKIGESHVGTQCVVCPESKYSLNPATNCLECVPEAICYGNYTMVPKPGYWRTNMYTATFWKCPYQPACIGSPMTAPLSLTGQCAIGYFGNLCNGCTSGFSRLNAAACGKCPSFSVNLVRTLGIGIAVLLFLVIIVASAIRSAKVKKSYFSIYIKILLNYLQLVMLTANFNLSWPSYVLELFNIQKTAGSVTDQIFSIDCFINNSSEDAQVSAVRTKIIFIAFLPLALLLLSLIFWLPFAICKRRLSYLKNELVTTNVVFFFLVHPSIVKFMFDFFNCTQLNPGEYWMNSYLNIRCWDTDHYRYAFFVALPSIIGWGVGLPTLCLIFLIKYRHHLNLVGMRMRLGFIYNGYEAKSFYWELVILYRKLLIISISVFLTNISTYLQALTVMIVILIAFGLQGKHNPYVIPVMNDLELRAIMVGGITIYSGLYYMSNVLDPTSEMALFIVIVVSNAYFLIYWMIHVFYAGFLIISSWIPCIGKLCSKKAYRVNAHVNPSTNPLSNVSDPLKQNENSLDISAVSIRQLSELQDESSIRQLPAHLGLPEPRIIVPDNSIVCLESEEKGKNIERKQQCDLKSDSLKPL